MINLMVYERLALSPTAFVGNLTQQARGWSRRTRDIGGYWSGDFYLYPDDTGMSFLEEFFDVGMGRRILERTYGIDTWEGEITQMDLSRNGTAWRRSMNVERWHNIVKVVYKDPSTGAQTATAWGEETTSSDIYGESRYIDTVTEEHTAAAAAATRDNRLSYNSFPKSYPISGFASMEEAGAENSLHIFCSGYAVGMNRRYAESDIVDAAISTQITALANASEFVTASRIETNSMSVPVKSSVINERLWAVIERLILMGGSSGRFVGGVYAGRKFIYEAAPTSAAYRWIGSPQRGMLVDSCGAQVVASLIKPPFIVFVTDAPVGITPPGAEAQHNPRNVYIEEVEFIAPVSYRLMAYGGGFELVGGAGA